MAAILDYCVFTKLVCPLPHSGCLTFSPVLPAVPWENGGLIAAMVMKRGVRLEGGLEVDSCYGNLTSHRPLPRYCPHQ